MSKSILPESELNFLRALIESYEDQEDNEADIDLDNDDWPTTQEQNK